MPLSPLAIEQITNIITREGNSWQELADYATQRAPAPTPDKTDVDAEWVKATATTVIKSNCKLTASAKSFVEQTLARAILYPTVKFSPKQWEWFNKIMLDAGIEAIDLPVEVK